MDNRDGILVEGLRCYWVDDELVFKLGNEDCDAIYSDIHGIEEDGLRQAQGPWRYILTRPMVFCL